MTAAIEAWLQRREQAVAWAQAMLCPGRSVVMAVHLSADDARVEVLDSATGGTVVSVRDLRAAVADLRSVTAGRRLLAYHDGCARDRLMLAATRARVGLAHLEFGDSWGSVMHAYSVWLGTPHRYYPLPRRVLSDPAAEAVTVLQRLRAIADDNTVSEGEHR